MRRHVWSYVFYKKLQGTYSPSVCPNDTVDVFITSWGRSGNTYSAEIIKRLYKDACIGSHGHSIASLKSASMHKVPTIVLFRDPMQAIPSFVVMKSYLDPNHDQDHVRSAVRDYFEYHEFLLSANYVGQLLEFSNVVNDLGVLVDAMERLGFVPSDGRDIEQVHQDVVRHLKRDTRPPEIRQLGSQEKQSKKNSLLPLVLHDEYWLAAKTVYAGLRSKSLSERRKNGR